MAVLAFVTACAHSTPRFTDIEPPEQVRSVVQLREDPEGGTQFIFPRRATPSELALLNKEQVRPFLTKVKDLRPPERIPLRLMESPGEALSNPHRVSPWETRLRQNLVSLLGPLRLPLPEPLETSRLLFALQRSAHYMDDGIREAAQEMFSAPAFLVSVSLSIAVYFAAWLVPEPFFSKGFAAALTMRLALLVGLAELSQLARACILLYQEVEAASSPQQLEAASERFGKSMGGAGLRVLLVVASLGWTQIHPQVPQSGLWNLLSPLRHAPASGPALESLASVHVLADGSLLVTGVAAGASAASLCGELATCMRMSGTGHPPASKSALSTRYGKPHTRQNPPHNEAIEDELTRRQAAGHTDLRKNKAQVDAQNVPVDDPHPLATYRFRKPDASSIRPDGVRHNTNYVSNSKDLQRELSAFDSMLRADPRAIHELYQLDGTLVRRYVPPGVQFP